MHVGMLQMNLLMSHQTLSNARDFGIKTDGAVYTPDEVDELMGTVGTHVKEVMAMITIGRHTLKSGSSASSSSRTIVHRV
jgi:hypothetical protein